MSSRPIPVRHWWRSTRPVSRVYLATSGRYATLIWIPTKFEAQRQAVCELIVGERCTVDRIERPTPTQTRDARRNFDAKYPGVLTHR